MALAVGITAFFLATAGLFMGTGIARAAEVRTGSTRNSTGGSIPTSHFDYRAGVR